MMSPITKHWREANAKLKDKVLSAPAPADPHAALDRMAADAERLGLYDEPAEVPLPARHTWDQHGTEAAYDLFTADQMKQYAAACVAAERERCAGLCEEVEAQAWALWKTNADPTEQGRSLGAQHCADAIRA